MPFQTRLGPESIFLPLLLLFRRSEQFMGGRTFATVDEARFLKLGDRIGFATHWLQCLTLVLEEDFASAGS